MGGRRRHMLEEYHKIAGLAAKNSTIMIAGAGFIGVEWATDLEYFFPEIKMTIIDFLPRCLGPLPDGAAEYCSEYMSAVGIEEFYGLKYEPKSQEFWDKVELPKGADFTYVCMGVKASNYFMPEETLSLKGPGGGGWIHFNRYLQVTTKPRVIDGAEELEGPVWGGGKFFAVGDCNYGCIGSPKKWLLPPIPKISYPGEEQALHACNNVERLAANHSMMVNWYLPAALQKEIIETTKVNECKNGIIGILIWHFVHHTPMNCFGRGPWKPHSGAFAPIGMNCFG